MKVYAVGGAVRDALLGLRVQDRDWVVVGSTPEAMAAQGYVPVGKDFPVFLHPQTREEYALARTERKTARGYKGFAVQASPDVTLEEDLARRDLTINAMAVPEALASALNDEPDSANAPTEPAPNASPTGSAKSSTRGAVWPTCAPNDCATSPRPLPKTQCASCGSLVLRPASPRSKWHPTPWR
jgi:hypothetical protein